MAFSEIADSPFTDNSSNPISAVSFSKQTEDPLYSRSESNYLAYGGDDGNVYIRDVSDWSLISASPLSQGSGTIDGIDWNSDSIAYAQGGEIYIHSRSDWSLSQNITVGSFLEHLAFNKAGTDVNYKHLAMADTSPEQTIYLFTHDGSSYVEKDSISGSDYPFNDSGTQFKSLSWSKTASPNVLYVAGDPIDVESFTYDSTDETLEAEEEIAYFVGSHDFVDVMNYHRNDYAYGIIGRYNEVDGIGEMILFYHNMNDLYEDYVINVHELSNGCFNQTYLGLSASYDMNWMATAANSDVYIFSPLWEGDSTRPPRDKIENTTEPRDMDFSFDTGFLAVADNEGSSGGSVRVYSVGQPSYTVKTYKDGTKVDLSILPCRNKSSLSAESDPALVQAIDYKFAFPELVNTGDSGDSGVHIYMDSSADTTKAWKKVI